MNSLIGGTIGDYALELPLGKGALGQTYRARQAGSGRAVALKIVDARLALRKEEHAVVRGLGLFKSAFGLGATDVDVF